MTSLYIELKSDGDLAQLRYRLPGKLEYETKSLQLAEIRDLYGFAERDFETRLPDLGAIGKRLFLWLDGEGRWLSRVTESARGVVLAIDATDRLAGLPWETMQDRQGWLVNRCIVPVRVVGGFGGNNPPPVASQYRLQTLFMATDPEGVEPKLDFEGEESRILAATNDLPIELRVEESGCLVRENNLPSELESLWRRYPEDYFHVFHLTGHASIRDNVPYFITESLTGDRVDATLEDFDRVFQLRYPRLMFLSGCRTGQSINGGAVPSLAASLVERGASAVLGWARPVSDTGATQAATELYRSLAQGLSIAEAVGLTYQALIREGVKDWCLLRLYGRVDAWGALVLPPGDVVPQQRQEAKLRFLDRQQQVRVAGADEFVGRRRYLQRGLRELKSSQNLGIWLHGIGGVGKSTIACRLLDRLGASYQSVVCYRDFDETVLLNLLSRECESISGHEILSSKLPLAQKLSQFLKQGLNAPEQRYLFILDDFEANLEERGDGSWVLKPSVVAPLTALLTGIDRSGLPHRVMITSRYDVKLPEFDRKLVRLQVERLDRSDVAKKYQRLKAFQAGSTVDRQLQAQAKSIADGYPRLLEWLDKILQDERTDSAAILAAMAGKQQEFLADILAQQLLAQQEPELRLMLSRGLIFELPVPLVAVQAICGEIRDLDRHLERGRSVGLLEVGLDGAVRVPRVLGLPVAENGAELAATGVQVLHREWIEPAETFTEEQWIELHRLALWAGNGEIAVDMAMRLSNSWIDNSRYREALTLCQNTLDLQRDTNMIYNLSKIHNTLGDWEKSIELAQESLTIDRAIGNKQGEAASLHQIAIIYTNQGQWAQALQSCTDSLTIYRAIGNKQGEAASLNQIAIIYTNQGQWAQALQSCTDSLTIQRAIGNKQGEAASLHVIAIIYTNQGQWAQALQSCTDSLTIQRAIGNKQGEAASLHQIAIIYTNQGQWAQALQSCTDSLTIQREIGNKQGEAASLNQIAIIYTNQGQWAQALQSCTDSLTIKRAIGDKQGEAASLHVIAIIYTNQGQWAQALQSCTDSLTIQRAIGNKQGEAASLHQIAIIYTNQGQWAEALQSCTDSLTIKRAIGDKQGEAASLAQMGYIAGKQGDATQRETFYLAAAQVCGEIGDYGGLAAMLRNLGFTVTDGALSYLAQALWLTRRLSTNLQDTIELIEAIHRRVPAGDPLEALLGATAFYFCQDSPHPEQAQLQERSIRMLDLAAEQGKMTQTQFDEWIVQNRLNDPNYYLPALEARLVEIIGDDWLFDLR